MTPIQIVNKAIPGAPAEKKADLLADILTYIVKALNAIRPNNLSVTIDKKLMTEYFKNE